MYAWDKVRRYGNDGDQARKRASKYGQCMRTQVAELDGAGRALSLLQLGRMAPSLLGGHGADAAVGAEIRAGAAGARDSGAVDARIDRQGRALELW